MFTWPPQLDDVKLDLDVTDTRDDARLQADLDAAVALVSRLRRASFNFTASSASLLPLPTDDVILGTIRMARRWNTRRRSPDGLVSAGDLGNSRVPNFDADIERMCGIGRYAGVVFG